MELVDLKVFLLEKSFELLNFDKLEVVLNYKTTKNTAVFTINT